MDEGLPRVAAFIAVGSNIDSERNILAALKLLYGRASIAAVSTFYRTRPLGLPAQADYVNGVWFIATQVTPRELKFEVLRPIEDTLGRKRGGDRYGPRTIDLDLVLYNDIVVDEPDLRLPSPDIDRPFVAIPLVELAPGLVLPGTGERLLSRYPRRRLPGMTAMRRFTRTLREALNNLEEPSCGKT